MTQPTYTPPAMAEDIAAVQHLMIRLAGGAGIERVPDLVRALNLRLGFLPPGGLLTGLTHWDGTARIVQIKKELDWFDSCLTVVHECGHVVIVTNAHLRKRYDMISRKEPHRLRSSAEEHVVERAAHLFLRGSL